MAIPEEKSICPPFAESLSNTPLTPLQPTEPAMTTGKHLNLIRKRKELT